MIRFARRELLAEAEFALDGDGSQDTGRFFRRTGGKGDSFFLVFCDGRRLSVWTRAARCEQILRRSSPDADQKVSAVSPTISGNRWKLLAMPLDGNLGTDSKGTIYPEACTGCGSIFQGRGFAAGRSGRVFPRDLSDRPQRIPRFDFTPVHAICIGGIACGFSYLGLGALRRDLAEQAHEPRGWQVRRDESGV